MKVHVARVPTRRGKWERADSSVLVFLEQSLCLGSVLSLWSERARTWDWVLLTLEHLRKPLALRPGRVLIL